MDGQLFRQGDVMAVDRKPKRTKIVDEDEARQWFYAGVPYPEFVRRYKEKYGIDTTPSMWSSWRSRNKLKRRKVRNDDLIPWQVAPEHRWDTMLRYLRFEARHRAGAPLADWEETALNGWLANMRGQGAVVYYDPINGFAYVKARPGEDLVRQPPGELATERRPTT
jgi:hypothetical protein